MRLLGVGVEKVEAEAARAFPHARLLRWDRDVTRTQGAHDRILASFLAHEADILIGTQMLAKGLDMPSVTLVGVVNADMGLHLPDFRAGERTFQLLTQVAGRAGRGERPGRVIIQTYTPDHYAIERRRGTTTTGSRRELKCGGRRGLSAVRAAGAADAGASEPALRARRRAAAAARACRTAAPRSERLDDHRAVARVRGARARPLALAAAAARPRSGGRWCGTSSCRRTGRWMWTRWSLL